MVKPMPQVFFAISQDKIYLTVGNLHFTTLRGTSHYDCWVAQTLV
jgi:hypothetical protein